MADSNSPSNHDSNEESNNAEDDTTATNTAGNGDIDKPDGDSDENKSSGSPNHEGKDANAGDSQSERGDKDDNDDEEDDSKDSHKKVKCEVCDDWLKDKSALDKHMKENHKKVWEKQKGEDPYRCVECGAVYFEQNRFKYHVQLHNWPSFDP